MKVEKFQFELNIMFFKIFILSGVAPKGPFYTVFPFLAYYVLYDFYL